MSNTEVQKEVDLKPDGTPISPNKAERRPLVELKNGKIVVRQKPLSCEKMSETMQDIVKFRDFLEQRAKVEQSALQCVPEEHIPLIAKLVNESDKTIGFLAKHIQEALQPEDANTAEDANSNGASLTTVAIESAILLVSDRVNYGIDWMERTPAALSIWRWEVKNYDLLPKGSRGKFESRLAERKQTKQELRALFDTLPQAEKDALMKSGRKGKAEVVHTSSITDENKSTHASPADTQSEMKLNGSLEDACVTQKPIGRPKKEKPVDLERLAKEKEKAERKAAKEERERKQQQMQNKSRSIMSSFFAKPKATNSKLLRPASASSSLANDPSSSKSEFERIFKPFVLRKDAKLAPINYFDEVRKAEDVIVIDQEPSMSPPDTVSRASDPTSQDSQKLFSEYIACLSPRLRRLPKVYSANSPRYKSSSMFCVRNIFAQLSEAEVLGDDITVRSLHALLKTRNKIPAKVLTFHEDTRPGYYGTFTRSSAVIGPRTPFAKDAVAFDYGYDSGEEWEEEEEGADDLLSVTGSDAGESSDVGSDELDDWLVDDDEPIDPGTPLSDRAGSPGFPLTQELLPKRKAAVDGEVKESKKRKVMPLVPFSKGPCMEVNIGECDYEPFKQYRIQLFNDTPFPIDPFTFVSTPVLVDRPAPTQPAFAVPALPAHVQVSGSNVNSATLGPLPPTVSDVIVHPSAAPTTTVQGNAKRTPLQPKNPFPPALLPYFADKVASLNSGNLTWLVESLYQDLKGHRVKKIAIEAKVREDCEKCPVRKIWIVKGDVLRSLGRTPPPVPSI